MRFILSSLIAFFALLCSVHASPAASPLAFPAPIPEPRTLEAREVRKRAFVRHALSMVPNIYGENKRCQGAITAISALHPTQIPESQQVLRLMKRIPPHKLDSAIHFMKVDVTMATRVGGVDFVKLMQLLLVEFPEAKEHCGTLKL